MRNIFKLFLITVTISSITISYTGAYFTDKDEIGSTINSDEWTPQLPSLLISEVYYDTTSDQDEGKHEWVEIYNTSDVTINFKNWTLSDNHNTATFHSNAEIPPKSYAILTHNKSIKNDLNLGNDVNIIVSTSWKLELSNSGDRVLLKNPGLDIIDAMSYGNDNFIFDPACTDVAEGHSLERLDLTTDTNTSVDFFDNSNPTPGT